jgi:hypothetical protein
VIEEREDMKRSVVKKTDGLEIEVSDVEGKEDQFLEAFQECAEGRCTCPTQEYTKLEQLHVEQGSRGITLRLVAKKPRQLDQAEIERCLDYTQERVEEI